MAAAFQDVLLCRHIVESFYIVISEGHWPKEDFAALFHLYHFFHDEVYHYRADYFLISSVHPARAAGAFRA